MGEDQPEAEPDPLPCPLSRDSSAVQVQTSSQMGQSTSSLTGDHIFTEDLRFFGAGSGLMGLLGAERLGDRRGEDPLVIWWLLARGLDRLDDDGTAALLFGGVGRTTGVCTRAGLPARL